MINKELNFIDHIVHVLEILFNWFKDLVDALLYEKPTTVNTDFGVKGEVISRRFNKEGVVADGKASLDRKTCFENVALFGSTGTGKGIYCVTPSALHIDDASVVIHDPSGTIFKATSGNFIRKGYKVKVLDWENSKTSSGYNPIVNAKNSTEIASISHILIAASMGKSNSDPFWRLASESQMSMLVALCKELPEHLQHLPNVLHMLEFLSHSPKEFDKFVAKYCKSEKLWSQYKSYIAQSEKLNSSITANTKAAMKIFEMDDLALTMSFNEIDFQSLRKTKTVIYLKNNIAKQKLYGPATSIFVTQLFESIFSNIPEKEELPIMMFLDEMSSIYISDFSTYLSNVRKHFCSVFHVWQSPSQLKDIYKEQADAILANSRSQIIIPAGMDYNSAKLFSDRMGMFDWEDEKGRRSKRQLMHPQELIQSEPNIGFLFVGHHQPMKLTLLPYFEQRKLTKLSAIDPPVLKSNADNRGIPLFNFKSI
jgi:type IV secretory pathway TraG/TraD family ATPase VirD4